MPGFADIARRVPVAQNQHALAFLVEDALVTGRTALVFRRYIASWWAATAAEQQSMLDLLAAAKAVLDERFGPSGYSVHFDTDPGEVGFGGVVVHLLPMYAGDGPGGHRRVEAVTPLITPAEGRLRRALIGAINDERFDRIDLVVSFVMRSGLNVIASHVDEALGRGARFRILTTDYLGITDTSALGFLLDRAGRGAAGTTGELSARVFCDPATSFHPKGYIFTNSVSGEGVAFVGSSNLSESGISHGVEWNLRSEQVHVLLDEFETLWTDRRSQPLTAAWLADYERRRPLRTDGTGHEPTGEEAPEPAPTPNEVQRLALDALEETRLSGYRAGLVVMATGLGKTWLAAFDSTRPQFHRVLFIAHRDEILRQARDVFRRVRPDGRFSFFTGTERDTTGDVVFASVQSLTRHLEDIDPDEFDYVVVDEFHHADAPSYRRTIGHLRPEFLLGLTATPDRSDGADLLALCADNLVYHCDLVEGIKQGLLSSFRYRAIRDVADYEHIPWRSGKFDPAALGQHLATEQRAAQVFEEWSKLGGADRRALGFCCTIFHAEFMANYFESTGARAVAVHSGTGSADRYESLEQLAAGEIDVVFTVDLFNEGVDVPSIDTVLMLRPTESPIVFFQQLGRGLRRHADKTRLEVIDLVGNHRSFLLKARLLAELGGATAPSPRKAIEVLRGDHELPPGCSMVIDPEVIDLLALLAGAPKGDALIGQLIDEWMASHDGRRPTALEFALRSNERVGTRATDGWFGALSRLGLLSAAEAATFDAARRFLTDIEFGAYTKSWKLVTLQALLDAQALRRGMPIRDLALASRWAVMRDRRLRNDLFDTSSAFDDPTRPSDREWVAYWRKNPIAAWTTSGQTPAWFRVVEDEFVLDLAAAEALGPEFEEMVRELVEYRLHRYLESKRKLAVGEVRKVRGDDGTGIDATFRVETNDGVVSVVFESAGGTAGSGSARNIDYVKGLDLVLGRLAAVGIEVDNAYVDSSMTKDLPTDQRRLDPGNAGQFPVRLDAVDLVQLRRDFLRSSAKVGSTTKTGSGGNSRKRLRLVLERVPSDARTLADQLATGVQLAAETG